MTLVIAGPNVGRKVGLNDGVRDGRILVGKNVGVPVGMDGARDGVIVVGCSVGESVETEGDLVGVIEGL